MTNGTLPPKRRPGVRSARPVEGRTTQTSSPSEPTTATRDSTFDGVSTRSVELPSTSGTRKLNAPGVTGVTGVTRVEGVEGVEGEGFQVGTAHHVEPLVGPEQVNGAMAALVASARSELLVVMHAITNDAMVALLEQRARDGVAVTVVRNDPSTQLGISFAKRDHEIALLDRLRAAGAKVVIVPQAQLALATSQPLPHDHRKVIVADRKRAYVGGSNPRTQTDNFDAGFVVSGPVAKVLARKVAVDVARYTGHVDKLPLPANNPDAGTLDVLGTADAGRDTRSAIFAAIAGARTRITLAHQEIDDDEIIAALIARKAELPELDINVLIGPRKLTRTVAGMVTSLPMNLAAIDALPTAGIHVYSATTRLQRGGIMHAKLLVVDGKEVICGSSDLNARSFSGNVELDLRVRDERVARAMEQGILAEIAQSTPVTPSTARERIVGRTVDTLRSAVIGFHRSRRLMRRMSFGLSPAGRRILARQKLGMKGPAVDVRPLTSVRDAQARLALALASTSTQAGEARAVSSGLLRPGERLLFVGVPDDKAALLERGAFPHAINANFGAGIYLASDAHSAVDYALVRTKQQGASKAGAVFVVAAKLARPFRLPAGEAELAAWAAQQPGAPSNPLQSLPHYCRAHGFDSVVVHGAEGEGRDYVIVFDDTKLRPVLRQNLR